MLANCALLPTPSTLPAATPPARVATAPVDDDTDAMNGSQPQPLLPQVYCCEDAKTKSPGPTATSLMYWTAATVVTTPVAATIALSWPL